MATAAERLRSSEVRVHYPDGFCRDGVILALRGGVMRVAIQGSDDTAEFTLVDGNWFCEESNPVAFEFPCAREANHGRAATAWLGRRQDRAQA